MGELETSLTSEEYREWMQFYAIDPWGEQRADMRMAQTMWAVLQPHTKAALDANDFMLFPDEANELPDDIDAKERRWMLKLNRNAKED